MIKKGDFPYTPPLKAFEVITLVRLRGVKTPILKKYIAISHRIPQNVKDVGGGKNERFVEARQLSHYKVVVV